ncbi:hypothetical protein B6D60_02315 [candidate division KSB1 bacterium 4484_87]|nr:MAG: hypothetical protein B6D60_02315 [candidate division KSB1 bacterium 4484_87]
MTAHVCMILESTYPYAIGGISSWVQEIISSMKDVEFSIVHLYSGEKPTKMMFPLPPNVRTLLNLPILIDKEHADFELILSQIPDADLYHSLSTGFAGWIGTEIKQRKDKPFLLTEHGIYWHEIELGADEIECGFKVMKMKRTELFLGQNWFSWLQFFKTIAKRAYREADLITTVCERNRKMEMSVSNDAGKCRVIRNGVNVPQKTAIKEYHCSAAPSIGLIGRVTPIKDIETFIHACDKVRAHFPEARFYIVGPIQNAIRFYANLDLVVLTSISEGQPFALLEAMAAGIPVVATDVGGCDEVVNGANDGLGPAGLLCRVGDVTGIAAAMLQILKNQFLWHEFAQNGRKRIEKFYRADQMTQNYKNAYMQLISHEKSNENNDVLDLVKARSE